MKASKDALPAEAFKLAATICSAGVMGFGLLGLVSRYTGLHTLSSLSPHYIPMATSTAWEFLLLGAILLLETQRFLSARAGALAKAVIVLLAVCALLIYLKPFIGVDLNLEEQFFRPTERFGAVLTNRMSPVTALILFLAAIGLLLILRRKDQAGSRDLAGFLGCLVTIGGFIGALGYLFGTPLLYGGGVIPLALSTVGAFLLLGMGLMAGAGPEALPLRLLVGSSTRARLLRAFLPLTVGVILFQGLLQEYVPGLFLNRGLVAALLALSFALITGVLVGVVGRALGQALDRAEAARRQAQEALLESRRQAALFTDLLEHSSQAFVVGYPDGRVGVCNTAFPQMLGYSKAELLALNWYRDITPPEWWEKEQALLAELHRSGQPVRYEKEYWRQDGTRLPVELFVHLNRDEQGQPAFYYAFITDITERQRQETAQRVALRFLEIVHHHTEIDSLLNAFVTEIKDYTGCEAVGIRVLDNTGGIPYQAYVGFSQQFYASESPLSINTDHCRCVDVIKGNCDPKLIFYTPGGSFYLNGTSRFLATVSEEDKGRTRNACNREGYESVALIPFRRGDRILGLIHVADRREDMVPLHLVEMLEKVAMQLGTAFERLQAQEALRESEARFRGLFDNMTEGVALHELIYDDHGLAVDYRIVSTNPAFTKHTGLQPEQIQGQLASQAYGMDPAPYLEIYSQVAQSGQPCVFATFFPPLRRYFHVSATSAKPGQFVTVFEDITERRLAEEALKEIGRVKSELLDKLNEAQQVAAIGSWEWNLQTNNVWWSDETYRIFGVTPQDFVPSFEANGKFIHPDDFAIYRKSFEHSFQTGEPLDYDCRLVTNDGLLKHISAKGNAIYDDSGRPIRFIGTVMDITERKRVEDAVAAERQRFYSLLEAMPAYVGLLTPDYQVAFANQYFREHFGEPEGRRCYEYMFGRSEPCENCLAYKVLETKRPEEYEWLGPDGRTYQICDQLVHDTDGSPLILEMGIDITARKQAEEALRDNEQFLTDIFNSIQDGLSILDPELNIIRVNRAMEEFGYIQPLAGRKCYEVYHGRSEPCEVCPSRQSLRTGKATREIVTEHLAEGNDRFMEIQAFPLLNRASGQVQGVIEYVRDITEHRKAEKALEEEAIRRRLLFEQSRDGIVVLDENGKVYEANQRYAEMLGYSLEEVQQLHVWDWDAKWTREQLEKIIRSSDEGGQIFETVHRRKDGTVYDVEISANAVMLAGQKLVFGVCRDISQRKHAEAEHARFSKLESLATLAGGIAHDFNNILTAILGNISLATLELQNEKRSRERLSAAERACLQAQALSRQLLTFAKGGAPLKELVSVEKIITEIASFSSRGSQVRCAFAFPDNFWAVEADPGQINQVFQNLVINAIQAMPTGGTIKISGENLVVEAGSDLPLNPGRYVKVSVQDQGVGMPAEYLSKIFDPYFTTKQMGSGLGLATAYSIVKNHHGLISVESKLGEGTAFNVFLPASDKKLIPVAAEDKGLLSGRGKILVMDDEDMVRQVLGKMLELLGYEAELARDGNEAIELFIGAQESGKPFAALILDLTVPGGMGGQEVMEKLLKIDPRVKAIVSSGYSEDPIMAEFEKFGFSGIIAKPYKVPELGKVLQKVILEKIGGIQGVGAAQ